MIIPNILKPNDTIGIFAPAGFYDMGEMISNIANFKKLGFKIKLGKSIFNKYGYLAGTDKERANDFNALISSDEVKALIAFRGGYGCLRMLPYIDINNVRKNPKFICGFSDLTALINYITDKTSLVTLHGPMINSNFNDFSTYSSLTQMLFDKTQIEYDFSSLKTYNEKNISGILSGGNLATICSCIGTPYEINFDNKIVLLEEINEDPYKIDKFLTQLILGNKLDKCLGFMIGYINYSNPEYRINKNSFTIDEIIQEKLVPLNKPIIYGLPCGHSYPNITLPIGGTIKLDFNKKILYSL